jgi:hypothetical protein
MPIPQTLGPDEATARLNSGGDAVKAMEADRADEARSAQDKYREQAIEKLKLLGVATLYEDIPDNSPVLASSLARITDVTGIVPIKETVTVANQGGNWTFDLYHFPKYLSPGFRYSANEALLALSPDSVIASLRAGGYIRGQQ